MIFSETFKNIKRLREIIQILVKYGFEDIVTNSTLRNFISESKRVTWLRQDRPVFGYTTYERIRMATEELGPTFIKFAQILSNRPDMIPEPLIKELEKLQNHVAPFPFEQAKQIIERETKRSIGSMFEEFNEDVLASASIGQVYKAKLRTGEEVVMKVQRPGIQEVIERDLSIIKEVVKRADRYLKKEGIINAKEVVETFERSMLKELDYQNEARNIERFRQKYKNDNKLYIPRAYREFSTQKVLIIEYVYGCRITEVKKIKEWGLDATKLAENGMDIYLTQIFEFGHFHADPHPGNVMVMPNGKICLIDFGMVGHLMQKDKYAFAGVFISLAQQDSKMMAENMRKLAISHEITDMRSFEYDLNEIIEDFTNLDVSESSIADMIERLQKVMFMYQIMVPGGVFLIFRALAVLEGIGKIIHPNFNTYEFIKPYGAKIIQERFQPQNIYNEVNYRFSQISSFINTFPTDVKGILQKASKGKLHFEIELQGYGYLLKKLDSLTNRLTLTFLISALVIASSISMLGDFPAEHRTEFGIPTISMAGLTIAGGLTLMLVYAIIRRRKYK
jgi:ubiquinone biosynthesis protein